VIDMSRFRTAGLVAAALVAGVLTGAPGEALAAGSSATAGCALELGSVTAGGDHADRVMTAGAPPTVQEKRRYTKLYPEGRPRLSSVFFKATGIPGFDSANFGDVVIGSGLYSSSYFIGTNGEIDPTQTHNFRIGGGWADVTFLETSYPKSSDPFAVVNHYALHSNGTLTRWDSKGAFWSNPQSAGGFSAVKTMALISQTATYDTFLANTRGGALYTIRLPRTAPLKPVVKRVRDRTWQGFDALVAEKCGQYGTLLLGIDKDTQSGYLYAVGHANVPATVIQGLGKVPTTFADPIYFRRTLERPNAALLFGE
jgi:hypothetical protein